jgi:hypothetical protein
MKISKNDIATNGMRSARGKATGNDEGEQQAERIDSTGKVGQIVGS